MPHRIRYNLRYFVSNLDVSPLLEDLLENSVLDLEEFEAAFALEGDKLEISKYVVRLMLKQTAEQVDAFLAVVERYQPDLANHVAKTMEDGLSTGAANSAGATTQVSREREKVKRTSSTSSPDSSGQYNKQQVTGNTTGQHNTTSDTKNGQSNTTGAPTQSQPTSQENQTPDTTPLQTSQLLPNRDVYFTGRDNIVESVARTVLTPTAKESNGVKVQSLVAPAGFGKTSVAIAVGHICRAAGVLVEFFDLRGVAGVSTLQSMVTARLDGKFKSTPAKPKRKTGSKSKTDETPMLVILDNAEDAIQSGVGKDFQLQDVVKWIIELHGSIHVLLTSRVLFGAQVAEFKLEQHRLHCLRESSAVHLLQGLCTKDSVSSKTARQLVQHCGCVPLAVRITAGMLLGERFTADMLLAAFQEMGLDVFRDDDLKPSHQILRLLKLAYDMLRPEDKDTFHALSQIPTSFSSDAACAMVALAGNNVSRVHVLRFDPLIKICFLEFDAMANRYSLQPFIAEFGRYSCPELERDDYARRLCKHYLGLLINGKFSTTGCNPELAMVLSAQLLQEYPNIQHASRLSVDVMTDRDFAMNGVLMTRHGIIFHAMLDKRFLERMALLKDIPYSSRVAAGCALSTCVGIETIEHGAVILDQLCPKDHSDTCEESKRDILFANFAVQSAKAMLSILSDCHKNAKRLSSQSIAELEGARQKLIDTRKNCQLTNEEDIASQVMEQAFSIILGKNVPDSNDVEDLYSRVVTARYLSENGETLTNITIHDALERILEMGMASGVQWNVSPVMLKMVGISISPRKHVYSALPRFQLMADEAAWQACIFQHQFAARADSTQASQLLHSLNVLWCDTRVLEWDVNLPTPFSLVSLPQSYRSIVVNYTRRYCNGSRSNGEIETRIPGLLETSTVQCCLEYVNCLEMFSAHCFYSVELAAAVNSLIKECTDNLPTNSARGLSVSGIVYKFATKSCVLATLFALHQQSKRGDVNIKHHIELLEWCEVAPACFVCYNLDTVEACPRCGITWLCAKHNIDKYQSEHAEQHCAMLRVLRQRLHRYKAHCRERMCRSS